ncbi:hypothetical protein BOTBODRAFT_143115 [Botryobasidium botryosum FD-172 SS1]|uniref:Protein kinase domain-containing protein n=1 Tax=Botryobasidium botryosum (strain FD-172 SS1) TaxID=930990 RepID=A0A067N6B5_BOTB1|nr:hypothetical protein BOTBODRAFT_143115 [Botryobasidium botryosum FD-172 SS1]
MPVDFFKAQEDVKGPLVYCNRPLSATSIPVTLLHPVFGTFVDDSQNYAPAATDYAFVFDLTLSMSGYFSSEDERRDAFIKLLFDYYEIQLSPSEIGAGYRTDGHVIVGGFIPALTEAKGKFASDGAEPYFQGCTYYVEAYKTAHSEASFGFAELAATDRPHADVLGPILPPFCNPHDAQLKETIVRFFGAFKNAFHSLKAYYEVEIPKLRSLTSPSSVQPLFPYPRTYTSLGENPTSVAFQYTRKYDTLRPTQLIFYGADEEDDQVGRKLCIKFVRRYSKEAHELCALQGQAPALYGFEKLAGGWYTIVMEDLEAHIPYNEAHGLSPAQRRLVRSEVLECMHALHSQNIAHGDIRGANILINVHPENGSLSVKLIDFDWAGTAGVVKYLMNVNCKEVRRPQGAVDGLPILKEHDLIMVYWATPMPADSDPVV